MELKEKSDILITFQALAFIFGLIANIITLITLTINGNDFPMISRILFKNLAGADIFVCIMGLVICIQPFMWMTGNDTFDLILCQVWHSQAIYWTGVFISMYCLVFIAVERFVMIEYPYKHRNIKPRHIYIALLIMYIVSFILVLPPCSLQTRYDEKLGACLGEYYFDSHIYKGFMAFFGIFWFVMGYSVPIIIFITLYTKIVLTIRQRQETQKANGQRILETADRYLTRTAIAVSVVFSVCVGWESWWYLFGRVGLIRYEKDTWYSVMGAFLATFNSCANPLIYCASLPIFRKSLKKTFSFLFSVNNGPSKGEGNSFITTAIQESNKNTTPTGMTS